ncbi:MAG: NAD(P)H-dependent oxidoreductase subunit E [Dehalococcoidia bacterium]|nr:MAG: NAD(P)H-dependent oxidoreductase subunit E [Dehalococcoidia bacterium]
MESLQLKSILRDRISQPHQLIEVLQDIQESFGYIPEDSMREISTTLGTPLIEVYRVVSFYKAFKLKPSGKYTITICNGTACHVRGAKLLLDQAVNQLGIQSGEVTEDGLFSIENVNCLGACALGPIASENGTIGHHMTPAKLRKLIDLLHTKEKEKAKNASAKH